MSRPLCRYCGKPIAKRTVSIRFVEELKAFMKNDTFTIYVLGKPMSKEEAARLTNLQIVSVKRDSNPWAHNPGDKYICEAGGWDGESYVDPYFCNGQHAKDFAYMIAKARPELGSTDWADAVERQREKEPAR